MSDIPKQVLFEEKQRFRQPFEWIILGGLSILFTYGLITQVFWGMILAQPLFQMGSLLSYGSSLLWDFPGPFGKRRWLLAFIPTTLESPFSRLSVKRKFSVMTKFLKSKMSPIGRLSIMAATESKRGPREKPTMFTVRRASSFGSRRMRHYLLVLSTPMSSMKSWKIE